MNNGANLRKVGVFKLVTLLALVVILPLSAIFVAKLNSKVGLDTLPSAKAQRTTLVDKVQNGTLTQEDVLNEIEIVKQLIDSKGIQSVLDEYGIDLNVEKITADYQDALAGVEQVQDEGALQGAQSRFWSGTHDVGTFRHDDKRGIEYLNIELIYWGALCASIGLMAAAVALAGTLAAAPTFGLGALIGYITAGILALGATHSWGNAQSAHNAMRQAIGLAKRGETYHVERYWFLGITTGYNVW